MKKIIVFGAIAVATVACGTSLTSLDSRAILNQQRACAAIATRAASMDAGPIQSLAEACQCGAVGVLRRAGAESDDAGDLCPATPPSDGGH